MSMWLEFARLGPEGQKALAGGQAVVVAVN